MLFRTILIILSLCFLVQIADANELETPKARQLQSAYTYQFLKFVSWKPPLHSSEFGLCILSQNSLQLEKFQGLNGKLTSWGEVVIKSYPDPPSAQELQLCQGVFIDTGYPYHSIKNLINGQPLLTVVREDIDDTRMGVFIFLIQNDKMHFKVNMVRAGQKGIQVSASLLLLAVEVIER